MPFRVSVDEEKCIGCGACVSQCDNFEMDSGSMKAKVRKSEVDELGCNQEAADICPVQAIAVKEV